MITAALRAKLDDLAKHLYGFEHPNGPLWEKLAIETRVKYLATARTIEAAHVCGQSITEAAQRLATWWAVDHKVAVGWNVRSPQLQKLFLTQAERGYAFLNRDADNV